MSTSLSELNLKIEGMDCANCALTIERGVAQLPGVESVQVNFAAASLKATGMLDVEAIARRVQDLGYRVEKDTTQTANDDPAPVARHNGIMGFLRYLWAERSTAIALIGAALLVASLLVSLVQAALIRTWIVPVLQIFAMILAGHPIAIRGIRSLFKARQVTIELLMTIAAVGAVFIGETSEAATAMLLFAIGQAIERYTGDRARDSLKSLLALRPLKATVLHPCIDCAGHLGKNGYTGGPCPFCAPHEQVVPVEKVQVGETVLVRPGERIPIDGRITAGTSLIDQAHVTGESIPVSKTISDKVYAGTINGEAAIEIVATRPAADSTISRVVRLVEQAQAQRAPIERFVDRFAQWYTPAAVIAAFLVAIVPPLVFSAPFWNLPDGTHGWLYRALSLLIVSCPCALVISTPVTVVSAMTALARRGVLVKGGVFLDVLSRVKTFAFDKTGTLTQGRPTIKVTRSLDCSYLDQNKSHDCQSCDDMLALAAAVERRSEHPLAQAILAKAANRDVLQRYPAAATVQALSGQGVEGKLEGNTITVGSHTLFHERNVECADLHHQIQAAEADGQTVMLIGRDDQMLGFIGVADEPRPSTSDALRALKQVVPQATIMMLTGDNPSVAQRIADQIGSIDYIRADLLPVDKLTTIRELEQEFSEVAMIGDGVNDAPALAAASVGLAMGGAGAAQAMETADVVLMKDDLTQLADAARTSRQARHVIQQNIIFSLAIKAAFLMLAVGGLATLWMAVIADVGASIAVTLNGIRMLKQS